MSCAALILVEPSLGGNLGAAIRVTANFGVPRLLLVRPHVSPDDEVVTSWACGGQEHVEIEVFDSLAEAAAPFRTLVATASSRGRENQPVITPREAVESIGRRGPGGTALVFGNETRGLCRQDLDRCDLVVRLPTSPGFPVLNLTQAIAVLLGYLSIEAEPSPPTSPEPAPQAHVAALMEHLRTSLLAIGFLDPVNPDRILRKLRRLFGRAGITDNEATILHGICRQMEWAAGTRHERVEAGEEKGTEPQRREAREEET